MKKHTLNCIRELIQKLPGTKTKMDLWLEYKIIDKDDDPIIQYIKLLIEFRKFGTNINIINDSEIEVTDHLRTKRIIFDDRLKILMPKITQIMLEAAP